ncbi:hypothetical protein [Rhizobium anhuiense]|nr:hypothetical protein [Rhizobium anhuiense]
MIPEKLSRIRRFPTFAGEVRALYQDDASLRVPSQVFNAVHTRLEDVGAV